MDTNLSAPNLIATKKQKKSMPKKNTARTVKTAPAKLPIVPQYAAGRSLTVTGYAGGSSRTKKVSIVAFVKAGENIFAAFAAKYGFEVPNGAKNMEIRFGRAVSKDARYIVREMKTSASNPRNKIAAFFSPTVASVEKQNAKASASKKTSAPASVSSATTTVTPAPSTSPASPYLRGY